MREFLSKSIAGGLSAGVVLLWWPALFDDVDSVTSWLVRGAAWTVLLEALLLALVPLERALWETARGERLSSRVGATASRLHSGPHRHRLARLGGIAAVAVGVAGGLLATGLREHAAADPRAEAPQVRPIKVVRVTKVVNVKRVVRAEAASARPVAATPDPEESAPAPVTSRETGTPKGEVVVGRTAPVQREGAPGTRPELAPEPAPAEQDGDAEGSAAPPASGSSTL